MDERLRVLIEELRHMRAARKMTQEELAKAVNYSPSTVAMVETGARKPPPDFWERVDVALDTGGAFARMLARLGSPQWMREWEANERQATVLRSFQNMVVPGLLQTAAYARALFRSVGLFDEQEVERRAEARLARQAVLAGERPPQLVAVLDEHVLRRPVGGPVVMREQLLRLVKVATEHTRVRLHVVPASVGRVSRCRRGLRAGYAAHRGGRRLSGRSAQGSGDRPHRGRAGGPVGLGVDPGRGAAAPAVDRSVDGGGEVMELTGARWRTSTRSSTNGGDCVEVADNLPGLVAVRDSKDRDGGVLTFSPAAWRSFVCPHPLTRPVETSAPLDHARRGLPTRHMSSDRQTGWP